MHFDLTNGTWQVKAGRGDKGQRSIFSYFLCADIETSYVDGDKPADMKAWSYQQAIAMFDIETGDLKGYEETRNILDFVENIFNFNTAIKNRGDGKGIVFIHNLAFDLRFFRAMLIERFGDVEHDDFLIDNKHWLYFRIDRVEFRCSYKLTNMSLYTFTKEMNVEHRKLLGANDYGIHYSDEELSQDFHDYMRNDVLGMGESICKFFQLENISFRNAPYTATGFVRNHTRAEFRKDKMEISVFQRSQPTAYEFVTWCDSYSGGFTQANEKYCGKLIKGKIRHRDFNSFYPSIIYTQMFPYGKGEMLEIPEDYEQAQEMLLDLIAKQEMIFAEIMIVDYVVNDGVMPFLPYIRATKLTQNTSIQSYSHKIKIIHGAVVVSCSLPELMMIVKYSRFGHLIPLTVYKYKKHHMPQPILNTVREFFGLKSAYKAKEKACDESEKIYIHSLLMRAKAKLNAIYGELVEQQLRNKYEIDDNGNVQCVPFDFSNANEINNALYNYYDKARTGKCFSYAQGCYITAWCRYYLFEFCDVIGWNNVLYCDTDSAFYKSTPAIEERIEKLNDELRKVAIDTQAFVETNGKKDYLHHFDDENEEITMFKALNAKRYAYVYEKNGKSHFTVTSAGVPAGIGLHEDENGNAVYEYTREMELAGVDKQEDIITNIETAFKNFSNGDKKHAFVFKKCGGTVSEYNEYKPQWIEINGHKEYSCGGVAIKGCWKQMLEPNENEILETTDDVNDAEIVKLFRVNKTYEKI